MIRESRIMVIINTSVKNFDEYIKSLSPSAQKNYAYVQKHNQDLSYEKAEFNREEVEKFMRLWELQLVRGKPIQWAYPVGHVEQLSEHGRLLYFRALKGKEKVAGHFVQLHENFIECHPPMYEKSEENQNRYLAKFMWFNLIRYAIDNHLPPLNLGGGVDRWREMIKRRDEFPNPAYKWIYVSERAKRNPETEPDYELIETNGIKKLYERTN